MKLQQLIDLMDGDTAVVIAYQYENYKYQSVEELKEDYMFYEEIRDKSIKHIWHSRTLYGCIVLEIE